MNTAPPKTYTTAEIASYISGWTLANPDHPDTAAFRNALACLECPNDGIEAARESGRRQPETFTLLSEDLDRVEDAITAGIRYAEELLDNNPWGKGPMGMRMWLALSNDIGMMKEALKLV